MPAEQKNVAYTFDVSLIDTDSRPAFKVAPTLATGDFKISLDNGALANLGTLPTVAPAASAIVKIVLSQAEMNADRITIVCKDAAGAEWDDVVIAINTTAETVDTIKTETALILTDTGTTLQAELDAIQAAVITNATGVDIAADIIALKAETVLIVADTNELQTDWTNAGRLDAILDTIAADVVNVDGIAPAAAGAAMTLVADQAVNATKFGGAAVTATTSVTFPASSTVATTAGAVGSVTAGVTVTTNNDKTGYALTTAGILAIWHQAVAAIVTAGTIGKLLVDNIDAAITSRHASGAAVASVSGAVGSVTGAVGSVTGLTASNLDATVSSRMPTTHLAATAGKLDGVALADTVTTNTDMLTAAAVNAEVVDALNTDTYAEPGQGAPAATTTLAAKINYLYKAWRNKTEQTATVLSLYDDAGTTVDQKAAVSDDATTFTKAEIVTGP